jgi:hypothetical protein
MNPLLLKSLDHLCEYHNFVLVFHHQSLFLGVHQIVFSISNITMTPPVTPHLSKVSPLRRSPRLQNNHNIINPITANNTQASIPPNFSADTFPRPLSNLRTNLDILLEETLPDTAKALKRLPNYRCCRRECKDKRSSIDLEDCCCIELKLCSKYIHRKCYKTYVEEKFSFRTLFSTDGEALYSCTRKCYNTFLSSLNKKKTAQTQNNNNEIIINTTTTGSNTSSSNQVGNIETTTDTNKLRNNSNTNIIRNSTHTTTNTTTTNNNRLPVGTADNNNARVATNVPATQNRIIYWHQDGPRGKTDPNNSMRILLDWFQEEGNYAEYRNSNKQTHCEMLAARMNEAGVKVIRDQKMVRSKIDTMETRFRLADDFSNRETGAGLLGSQSCSGKNISVLL